jgi:hypothetical protein
MWRCWVIGLLVVVLMGCDTGSPEPTPYAPDDLASVLPQAVGGLSLEVEGEGGSEYLAESLGSESLASILKSDGGIGYDPDKMSFALASSSPGRDDARLIVWALRVAGVPADELGAPAGNQVWEALTDLGMWPGYHYTEQRVGEVVFGAVITSDELDITYDDVRAALPV